jgi:hypothetical protein
MEFVTLRGIVKKSIMARIRQIGLKTRQPAFLFCGLLILLVLCNASEIKAQDIRLRKGVAMDKVILSDSLAGNLALYLPTNYSNLTPSPLLFIAGSDDPLQSLRYFQNAAEQRGYIIAASTVPDDTLSLTDEVVHIHRVLNVLTQNLPINLSKIVVTGFGSDGQLAALLPSLIPELSGVLVLGAVPGLDGIKTSKLVPAMVVIMGRGDFGYSDMQLLEERFARNKVPLSVQYVSGGHQRPSERQLEIGLTAIELLGMQAERYAKDTALVAAAYNNQLSTINDFKKQGEWILAHHWIEQGIKLFDGLWDVASLKQELKLIERLPAYRAQKRWVALYQYKEQSQRLDFTLNLEEDLEDLNFENLGWWNFQMQELQKRKTSTQDEERVFASRMEDFANALVLDYIELIKKTNPSDLPALLWLNMLKTLTNPKAPEAYMEVMSLATRLGDTGTALYYLEVLLKTGYADYDALYQIPETALLRVEPQFNALVFKYLKKSRYPAAQPDSAQ